MLNRKRYLVISVLIVLSLLNIYDIITNWAEYGELFRYVFMSIPLGICLIASTRLFQKKRRFLDFILIIVAYSLSLLLFLPPSVYFSIVSN